MEEFWPCTETVCGVAAALSATVTSRTELTATDTSACAGANPVALTVRRYAPGRRSSSRNSPRSSLVAERCIGESTDLTTMLAEGMRAPVASCTVPRREPRGFWACRTAAPTIKDSTASSDLRNKFSLSPNGTHQHGEESHLKILAAITSARLERESSLWQRSTTSSGRKGVMQ